MNKFIGYILLLSAIIQFEAYCVECTNLLKYYNADSTEIDFILKELEKRRIPLENIRADLTALNHCKDQDKNNKELLKVITDLSNYYFTGNDSITLLSPFYLKYFCYGLSCNYLKNDILQILNNKLSYSGIEIAPFSDTLTKYLENDNYDYSLRIISLLPLDDQFKKKIMKSKKNLPVDVKARLGDKIAESAIIDSFRNIKDWTTTRQYIDYLSYCSTPSCIKTLVEAINSPLESEAFHCTTSIRVYILQGLGKKFPNEPLFNRELQHQLNVITFDKNRSDSVAAYIKKIISWGKINFKAKISNTIPPDIFLKKRPRVILKYFPPTIK
jgi:hypothetical protein